MSSEAPPSLTVLLPLRHYHPVYLRRAVNSILTQTSPRWNVLVVVDRENRATFKRLLRDDLLDPRVSLVENEGRKLAGKFNTGMRRAQTSYVAILLGDDMWSPTAVEVLSQRIAAFPEVDFFHSSRIFVDEDDRPVSSVYRSRESFSLEDFWVRSPVKHLLCWRRETALAMGGMDESLNSVGVDDFDFPWSMAEAGARFMAVAEPLYLLRDHRAGFRLTTHLPLSLHLKETRRIMEKHGAPAEVIAWRLADGKAGYLKQCLYSSPLDKWLKERFGRRPASAWKEPYR